MLNKEVTYKETRIMLDQYGRCCVQVREYCVSAAACGWEWLILYDTLPATKWWHHIFPQRKYAIFDTLEEAEKYMKEYLDRTKFVIYKPIV